MMDPPGVRKSKINEKCLSFCDVVFPVNSDEMVITCLERNFKISEGFMWDFVRIITRKRYMIQYQNFQCPHESPNKYLQETNKLLKFKDLYILYSLNFQKSYKQTSF